MSEEKRSLVSHVFPVNLPESLFFAVKGAFVEKCVLMLGESPLSIVKPDYGDYDVDNDKPPQVDVKFFADKPFHAALTSDWDGLRIHLMTRDTRTPTLIMIPAEESVTWDNVGGPALFDEVTAGSEAGEVTRTFVYMMHKGGFKSQK